MKNIFLGILIIGLGFLVTWKAYWITQNFGRDEWAENKFSGGTTTMYRIIGLAIIFFGMFLATGLLKNLLKVTLGSIFQF